MIKINNYIKHSIDSMIDFIEQEGNWTFQLRNIQPYLCELKKKSEDKYSKIFTGISCKEVLEKAVDFIREENVEYYGKRVRILNINSFEDNESYKELQSYIGKTGTIIKDYGSGYRFIIDYDVSYMNEIDKTNGRLCFTSSNIEII